MLTSEEVIKRNNVHVEGEGGRTILFAHGFGCDQNMWRFLKDDLIDDGNRAVLFDYCGSGQSDVSYYETDKYSKLDGYASDVVEICDALNLQDVLFVGHSVSSIIGLLATIRRPELFSRVVMVCPSPCFLNLPGYQGGFQRSDLEDLIDLMDKNYIGWAGYLAPLVMGSANSADLVKELNGSFCSTDPVLAKNFAKATFFADNRKDLEDMKHPTLILQSAVDALASPEIGTYMQNQMPGSVLQVIEAEGHCLHMTHPAEVVREIRAFVSAA